MDGNLGRHQTTVTTRVTTNACPTARGHPRHPQPGYSEKQRPHLYRKWHCPSADSRYELTRSMIIFISSPVSPSCIQPGDVASAASSEDCLYLNIFTPADLVKTQRTRYFIYSCLIFFDHIFSVKPEGACSSPGFLLQPFSQ